MKNILFICILSLLSCTEMHGFSAYNQRTQDLSTKISYVPVLPGFPDLESEIKRKLLHRINQHIVSKL